MRLTCGGVVFSFPFLPFLFQVTWVNSLSGSSLGCVFCVECLLLPWEVSSSLGRLCVSALLTGGGIESFSRASSLASILVKTVVVSVSASVQSEVGGGPGNGVCMRLSASGFVIKVTGGAVFLFVGCDAGEWSVRIEG